jgi:hypothetical protein
MAAIAIETAIETYSRRRMRRTEGIGRFQPAPFNPEKKQDEKSPPHLRRQGQDPL